MQAKERQILGLLAVILLQISTASARGNDLTLLDGCICPNHNITFQCTTVGGGITVWQGSAFLNHCLKGITLYHSQFNESVEMCCNDGAICAHADSIESPDCFVSNLMVFMTPVLDGRTVRCEYDNGTTVTLVHSFTLNITKTPLPGPLNVILADASPRHLTFIWTPISNSCRVQSYIINSSNCGVCPENTNLTTAYCTGFEVSEECMFTIRTVVCDNIIGTVGSDLSFLLQVPSPPRIINTTSYLSNNTLNRIVTTFTATSSNSTISGTINASTTSYTVTYSASPSGFICGSQTIPASKCSSEICIQEFDVITSTCFPSSDVTITVFASNIFGNGSSSDPIIRDGTNNFVLVEAQSDSIVCTFLRSMEEGEKSCSLVYGPDCQNLDSERLTGQTQEGNLVTVPLLQNTDVYCYHVTAISGDTSINITGHFSAGTKTNQLIILVVPIVVVIVLAVMILVIIISLGIYLYCNWQSRFSYRVSFSHKHHLQNTMQNETVFVFKNQIKSPYTYNELCETNTIRDTVNNIQDTNAYEKAPQEGCEMTFMDLLMLKTDTDY